MSEETELVYQTIGKLAVHAQTFKVSTTIDGLSALHASMNIDRELIETPLGRAVGRIHVVRDGPIKGNIQIVRLLFQNGGWCKWIGAQRRVTHPLDEYM